MLYSKLALCFVLLISCLYLHAMDDDDALVIAMNRAKPKDLELAKKFPTPESEEKAKKMVIAALGQEYESLQQLLANRLENGPTQPNIIPLYKVVNWFKGKKTQSDDFSPALPQPTFRKPFLDSIMEPSISKNDLLQTREEILGLFSGDGNNSISDPEFLQQAATHYILGELRATHQEEELLLQNSDYWKRFNGILAGAGTVAATILTILFSMKSEKCECDCSTS